MGLLWADYLQETQPRGRKSSIEWDQYPDRIKDTPEIPHFQQPFRRRHHKPVDNTPPKKQPDPYIKMWDCLTNETRAKILGDVKQGRKHICRGLYKLFEIQDLEHYGFIDMNGKFIIDVVKFLYNRLYLLKNLPQPQPQQ